MQSDKSVTYEEEIRIRGMIEFLHGKKTIRERIGEYVQKG